MKITFVPKSFDVPTKVSLTPFQLTVLEESNAEVDYQAVMSSLKRLKSIFGPNTSWPSEKMSLEENIASLQTHHREFIDRDAFAYSVFDESRTHCLGSVYIDPSRSPHYDCEVYLWVREDNADLDAILHTSVLTWLTEHWPFDKIAFPGRSISWQDWVKECRI
jgi:hypothetical protein